MRVRPFFWCLLVCSCLGVLIFATLVNGHTAALMSVRLVHQPPTSAAPTVLSVRLMDAVGFPIEQAHVLPSANMTNMEMVTNQVSVSTLGQGNYLVQLLLYMPGPWRIRILASGDDFDSLQQTLFVQVQAKQAAMTRTGARSESEECDLDLAPAFGEAAY